MQGTFLEIFINLDTVVYDEMLFKGKDGDAQCKIQGDRKSSRKALK